MKFNRNAQYPLSFTETFVVLTVIVSEPNENFESSVLPPCEKSFCVVWGNNNVYFEGIRLICGTHLVNIFTSAS